MAWGVEGVFEDGGKTLHQEVGVEELVDVLAGHDDHTPQEAHLEGAGSGRVATQYFE